jgi:hypothetical protein
MSDDEAEDDDDDDDDEQVDRPTGPFYCYCISVSIRCPAPTKGSAPPTQRRFGNHRCKELAGKDCESELDIIQLVRSGGDIIQWQHRWYRYNFGQLCGLKTVYIHLKRSWKPDIQVVFDKYQIQCSSGSRVEKEPRIYNSRSKSQIHIQGTKVLIPKSGSRRLNEKYIGWCQKGVSQLSYSQDHAWRKSQFYTKDRKRN